MSADATPDPYADRLVVGQRTQILRQRRGLTREQLGGLVGRSGSWVKAVETGRLKTPALPVLLRIAEVLRVRDLAELTGDQSVRIDLFTGAGHPRLAAVQAAVNALPLGSSPRPAPPTAHLNARLARAWEARHRAPDHREVIGRLLPDLILDAQATAREADTRAERRAAQAALAEVYALAQFFAAYQPDPALLWRLADRGMLAARESECPHAIGVAGWLLAQAHRDGGPAHFDAADQVTRDVLAHLEPLLPEADPEVRAITGALIFEAGYTAARRGETGVAWAHWDKAERVALTLPADYYHPVTSFGRAVMGAHAVTVAVELRTGGEAARQAARSDRTAIPSRPRRARHRIEMARGYHLDGQPDTALATLEQAHEAAPETIRYNGYAKRIVLEECESKSPTRRRRASELALKLGVLAA
ncbi:helix-turn-helix domain-containing protein [Streptomyces sp. BI20]|uniref:helix-turn-helix domain-containing protein n=1 Tax=Streptomyces sp. BI20 TaxID=3403460 RepID=UPI003C723F3E